MPLGVTVRRMPVLAAGFVAAAVALSAAGQRRLAFGAFEPPVHNAQYDGRFTFARIRYTTAPGGYQYCGLPSWAHGYLSCRGGIRAETGLVKIVNEISLLKPQVDDSVVLSLDDPDLTKFPIAYMVEAGYWTLSDQEAAAFRAYLLKGGLAIFDDFRDDSPTGGPAWDNFEGNMRRVIPGARFLDLPMTHPVFDSFFRIPSLDIIPQSYDFGRPIIRGLFEGNDPSKRLLAIVNYNTDVSDFWEFSVTGFRPIEESNEAYKLGVNYIMYGLLH
jgi:hypothetical protein